MSKAKAKKAVRSHLHKPVSLPVALLALIGVCVAIILFAKAATISQFNTSSEASGGRRNCSAFFGCGRYEECLGGVCVPEGSDITRTPRRHGMRPTLPERRRGAESGRRNCTDLFGCGRHEQCLNGRCVRQ